MTGHRSFIDIWMRSTGKLARLFGEADRGDPKAPIVHKHDAYENESDRELRDIEIETDTEGHHYAVRKSGRTWHK
ncbi:hypothetical protein [Arthrobacter castelli]|uniref:hypothetical protein n=1 Tax=Arthrobacter castelli TaxID=271431 RepID=UPI00047A291C|nr:hypothetical protein [Arthrobacter castelli]